MLLTTVTIIVILNKKYREKAKLVQEGQEILSKIITKIGDLDMGEPIKLLDIVKAKSTAQAYEDYARLVLEKVKDRYSKVFFKYFKAVEGEPISATNHYMLHFSIEPEDTDHYLKMNSLYVVHNLEDEVIERTVMKLLPEYIDMQGLSLLYFPEYQANLRYSALSSIAHDSRIIFYFSFVEDKDYPTVVTEIHEIAKKKEEEGK